MTWGVNVTFILTIDINRPIHDSMHSQSMLLFSRPAFERYSLQCLSNFKEMPHFARDDVSSYALISREYWFSASIIIGSENY